MDAAEHDVRAIEAIEQALASAWMMGDSETWAALLDHDWTVTHIHGEVITREQAMAMCRQPEARAATLRYDDLQVRLFDDAAVATGRTIATTGGASPETVILRFTDVLIRREGRWLVVASHATRVEGPHG